MTTAMTAMNSLELTSLAAVVNVVRRKEATTRPEIGKVTSWGRSVVSQRVEQAIDLGLLADFELGPSTGGRAPRHLRFVAERGCLVVGVFGAMGLSAAVTDLSGNVLAIEQGPWDISNGPEASLTHLARVFDRLLRNSSGVPVWAVVVGVPGPVEYSTGRPVAPPIMPGWNNVDIRGWLETRYHAPVWVDNDCNLMARGRLARMPENPDLDLLFVKVGTGIGAGLISGGRLHRGASGAAGDVGHIMIATDPAVVCRCGQIGCLEAVAGGWALARDGVVQAREGRSAYLASRVTKSGTLQPIDIVHGALSGDAVSVELVGQAGRIIGENVASMVSFFNPSVVAIGGAVAMAGDLFLAAVRQSVYQRSLPLATRDLQIIAATDAEEGVRGAAWLAIDELFETNTFASWLPDGKPEWDRTNLYRASA